MCLGALRFMVSGWVEKLFVEPQFFFKFYGFHWVEVPDILGVYILYSTIALGAAGIMLGWYYRLSALVFWLSFTYAELLDVTNYLNHYYLVCLLGFLLLLLPAHRAFSLDVRRRPDWQVSHVPAWTIYLLQTQIALVYFFAGFAKLNTDWLFHAMPLTVWLKEHHHWPVLGSLFQLPWVAFAFSWAGALYDLTIPLWLSLPRTRILAYGAVIVFHGLTRALFNIGLFPLIMIFNTLIFFPASFHERLLRPWGYRPAGHFRPYTYPRWAVRCLGPGLAIYLWLQVALPFRYLLYPGNVLWTEQGYRFAWRVMLVEKTGYATFYVRDGASDRHSEVVNSDFLTSYQEKQMAIQPDLILQFAHHLASYYQQHHGFRNPMVTVDSFVALNGRPSQQFINPTVNLATITDQLGPKTWILPLQPPAHRFNN